MRSGLGFGGAVFSLPLLLLVVDEPLIWLPILSVHLLVFAFYTVLQNHRKSTQRNTVDWHYLRNAMIILIIPKLMGVMGLITLPAQIMNGIIFFIIAVYSFTYILGKNFHSDNKALDILFLFLGGYISGTSLIGAPLVVAVFVRHVAREQLRDTLFVLWFILVTIKMAAFIAVDVDLQLDQQLWLLPVTTLGHWIGSYAHRYLMRADSRRFYQVIGVVLLISSSIGLWQAFQ